MGIVQFEGDVAGEYGGAARRDLTLRLFEQRQAGLERPREPGLFSFQDLDDEVALLHEHRIGTTHLLDGRVDQ